MASEQLLQFSALESCVHASFWTELAQSKLETLRLSEEPLEIGGAAAGLLRSPAL